MAVDNVITNSAVGLDGNSYTSNVSNDQLTNADFLTLMMEEMKMQDPTKPMDSAALMDSQLQMSSIQANQDMSAAMASLQNAYGASALSTAAGMIGHVIEDGSYGDDGVLNSYKVETIENRDGDLFVNARQMVGMVDALADSTDDNSLVIYDSDGFIYDGETKTDNRVSLDGKGRFEFNDDGTLKLLDQDGNVETDTAITEKYLFAGSSVRYAETQSIIAMSSILEVR